MFVAKIQWHPRWAVGRHFGSLLDCNELVLCGVSCCPSWPASFSNTINTRERNGNGGEGRKEGGWPLLHTHLILPTDEAIAQHPPPHPPLIYWLKDPNKCSKETPSITTQPKILRGPF